MWRPIDTEFYAPRIPVGIVALGLEVSQLRSFLESLQCVVHMHWIGTPGDFLKSINRDDDAPSYLIIEGHGDERGLHFGEYTSTVDTSMLVSGTMPPSVIRDAWYRAVKDADHEDIDAFGFFHNDGTEERFDRSVVGHQARLDAMIEADPYSRFRGL